jgi:hypothetical protein
VKGVLAGFYSDVAEQQTLNRYEVIKAQNTGTNWRQNRQPTKASNMAMDTVRSKMEHKRDVESGRVDQQMFKMKKFTSVRPRTNTHNGMKRVFSAAQI